jgi:hypothetical protein
MRLSFRYPPGWQASGSTFTASTGNVGQALVVGNTSSTVAEFKASASCSQRVRLLHDSGVFVSWGENIGTPVPIKLSQQSGRPTSVNGLPAKLAKIRSSDCGVTERVINGTIQVGAHEFLFMHAELGVNATTGTIETLKEMFATAKP